MIKIKYDINLMKYISLFENVTRSKVKDCIDNNGNLIFIVENGEIAKAIGKKAINIKKIEGLLKKKVRVIEFNEDISVFVGNLIRPLQVEDISYENGVVTITDSSNKTKGMIIGRDAVNLKKHKEIVSRYFDLEDIKVV
jgi:transcription termination/antitermination protein NusA